MIVPRVTFDAKPVLRRLARLPARSRKITAQELNRQRTKSRTLMTRDLSRALGVRPQKRIRKRIILPRQGRATERKLRADGLSLFEVAPGRWFAKGSRGRGGGFTMVLAGGSELLNTRSTRGQPFRAMMPNGRADIFRRVDPRRSGTVNTWLPIQKVQVDISRAGYAARNRALNQLAREWPRQWQGRMKRELRRAFGA